VTEIVSGLEEGMRVVIGTERAAPRAVAQAGSRPF
jgi:hypothetical protein